MEAAASSSSLVADDRQSTSASSSSSSSPRGRPQRVRPSIRQRGRPRMGPRGAPRRLHEGPDKARKESTTKRPRGQWAEETLRPASHQQQQQQQKQQQRHHVLLEAGAGALIKGEGVGAWPLAPIPHDDGEHPPSLSSPTASTASSTGSDAGVITRVGVGAAAASSRPQRPPARPGDRRRRCRTLPPPGFHPFLQRPSPSQRPPPPPESSREPVHFVAREARSPSPRRRHQQQPEQPLEQQEQKQKQQQQQLVLRDAARENPGPATRAVPVALVTTDRRGARVLVLVVVIAVKPRDDHLRRLDAPQNPTPPRLMEVFGGLRRARPRPRSSSYCPINALYQLPQQLQPPRPQDDVTCPRSTIAGPWAMTGAPRPSGWKSLSAEPTPLCSDSSSVSSASSSSLVSPSNNLDRAARVHPTTTPGAAVPGVVVASPASMSSATASAARAVLWTPTSSDQTPVITSSHQPFSRLYIDDDDDDRQYRDNQQLTSSSDRSMGGGPDVDCDESEDRGDNQRGGLSPRQRASTVPRPRRKVTIVDATQHMLDSLRGRRRRRRRNSTGGGEPPAELSTAQKRGCFQYIKRRHSIAMAFASMGETDPPPPCAQFQPWASDARAGDENPTNWEFVKVKHGVSVYRSKRSRCEIRGVTRVNASVKNVMSLLAAGETTESFAHAQRLLLGRDQVLEARVLASCVPSTASRYFHCGLKYLALKNPFGLSPLDLVFLEYTDVSTTPDDKLVGYRILESIRVPAFRSVAKYVRASIRCEVYVVRETGVPGVVEVTFASHLDPKSKYSSSKRHAWLEQTVVRLRNLREYAEKASFSHRLLLEKAKLVKGDTRHHCVLCESGFSFLRKRHNCRLCGEVTCGRCSHKLPIFVGTETTRVRVCVKCMLQSRRQPDELGRADLAVRGRRNSIGNSTWIAYDEIEAEEDEEDVDDGDET